MHDVRPAILTWSCVVALTAAVVFVQAPHPAAQAPARPKKHVLAWADVRNGYQHDAISHAVATLERLGYESGAYDTFIRTDSQLITKHPITFANGTGIATGADFLYRNLNYFDAIFFFGVREIDLAPQQRADLLSFVRDDGKGFVAAHSAATAFFSWPEFGDLLGGRFDEHPWGSDGIADATVVVDDHAFPAMRRFPDRVVMHDEHYQLKDFSRENVHVVAHLDPSSVDLDAPLVHRTDRDFPVAWSRPTGRVAFYLDTRACSGVVDNPPIQSIS